MYLMNKIEFRKKGYNNWKVNNYKTIGYRDTRIYAINHIRIDMDKYAHKDNYSWDNQDCGQFRCWFKDNGYDVKIVYNILEVV